MKSANRTACTWTLSPALPSIQTKPLPRRLKYRELARHPASTSPHHGIERDLALDLDAKAGIKLTAFNLNPKPYLTLNLKSP